jgi:hypothetical protein
MSKYATREEWLNAAAEIIASRFHDVFEQEFGADGMTHLESLHVSAGFPSAGGLAEKKKVIGQCWNSKTSADQHHHIFISPVLQDPVEVIATLAHEMVHAADDGEHGHKGAFTRAVRGMNLIGKPTATLAGEEFRAFALKSVQTLGAYPHVALQPTLKVKTQKTYMKKVVCDECDCVIRMTEKWLEAAGTPTCGCGGTMMEEE